MAKTDLVVILGEHLYSVERPWGAPPPGMELTTLQRIAVDSRGCVYVLQAGTPTMVVFDPEGGYVRSWGTGVIADPHGLHITPDDLVLVVDRDAHHVLGFDPEGRVCLSIGTRHRPRLQAPFNHPADIAIGTDGDLFVSDGYANSIVHRFTRDGQWKMSWGRRGTGSGEFTTPHAIWVDRGRVLVADRENNRIQVFDEDGTYLAEWPDFYHPMAIWVDAAGLAYITDQTPRLSLVAPDGTLLGRCRPVRHGAHGLWGDAAGNLYLVESRPGHLLTRLTRMS